MPEDEDKDNKWSWLRELVLKQPLVVVGAVLCIVAALGRVPIKDSPTMGVPFQVALFVLGAAFASVGVILYIKRGTGTTPQVRCEKYDVTVSSPQLNEVVSGQFDIAGVSKPLPEGYELWIFKIFTSDGERRYFPERCCNITGKTWRVRVSAPVGKQGQLRKYGVFLVGKDGQALIRCYLATARQLAPQGNWPPFADLTSDIVQCADERDVVLA